MCFLFANESSHVLEATKKKTHRGESFVTLVVAKMQRSLCLLQMQTLIWPDQPVEAAAADEAAQARRALPADDGRGEADAGHAG